LDPLHGPCDLHEHRLERILRLQQIERGVAGDYDRRPLSIPSSFYITATTIPDGLMECLEPGAGVYDC